MLKIKHNAGFFSCCSIRLENIISFFNEKKMLPIYVDSSEQFNEYKLNINDDITNIYFVQDDTIEINYEKNIILSTEEKELQFSNYKNILFENINFFIKKYFNVSDKINNIIEDLINKYNIDYENTCSIYYRGSDKIIETNIAPYEDFFERAQKIRNDNSNIKFLVQSDEKNFVDIFLNKFDNSFYIEELDFNRSFEHSLFLLSIVKIISKTKYIICSSSNVSLWIMFYRNNSNNIMQYLNEKEYIYGIKNNSYDVNKKIFWL